jgi:site-specific recombinase XerD
MQLRELTNTVNKLFYDNSSSYKTIMSIEKELLSIIGATTRVNKLDDIKVNNYFQELIKRGNKPTTINNKMMYLSKVLTYAHRTKLIQYKPYIPTMKIKATKDKALTAEEYELICQYSMNTDKELYRVIVIGYNTGIRISNILSLNPNTDIDNGYIRVFENKTNEPYSVPMNQAVKEVLQDFTGFTLNYRQVEYRFKQMIKALNLDTTITIHTLRHTSCTNLVKRGVPLPVVQALMNHKRISTTMRYNHLRNEQLEKAVSML